MRRSSWQRVVWCGLVVLTLGAAGFAQAEGPSDWTPARMLEVRRISSVQVSPDGQRVVFAAREAITTDDRSEFISHLHLAAADGSGSQQLTQGSASCDDPQWSPDGRWIAFIAARGGRKNVWLIPADSGEAFPLTDSPSDVTTFKWAPDGKSLALTALDPLTPDEERRRRQRDDARVVDESLKLRGLYLASVDDPPRQRQIPRRLTPPEISLASESRRASRAVFDWTPDGRQIVFTHTRSPKADDWTTADLSVFDLDRGTVRTLVATEAAESSPLVSPNGTSIAFVMGDAPPTWAGRRRMAVVPLAGGTPRLLAPTFDAFGQNSELIGWTADGKQLYFTESRGTNLHVLALPLDGSPEPIRTDEGMSTSGVSLNAARTHFGLAWETTKIAPEAYCTPLGAEKLTRVSRLHDEMKLPPVGETELLRWPSTESWEIEGLLTYPAGYQPGKRYPLILVIHGGPMSVFSRQFDGTPATYPIAALAARGYAVLRPNPRGSSGYGEKFRYANYGDWGGGDFRDLMLGVDHVIERGIADPDRLGVMGWSYGGFMTSWTITQTKRFRAAMVGAAVTNLVSFTGTADIPGFLPDYFGGEFWKDLEPYRLHSPMFHVAGVTTPALIQHGERDERVPLSQGLEFYNALRRQGCTTRLVIYPRMGHGIDEPRLLLDSMTRTLDWFDEHVLTAK